MGCTGCSGIRCCASCDSGGFDSGGIEDFEGSVDVVRIHFDSCFVVHSDDSWDFDSGSGNWGDSEDSEDSDGLDSGSDDSDDVEDSVDSEDPDDAHDLDSDLDSDSASSSSAPAPAP